MTGQIYIPSDAAAHDIYHELWHKYSQNGGTVVDAYGITHKKTGIREFFADGSNSAFADEALTEYLSSKHSDGVLYSSMYQVDNARLWERIDEALESVYSPNNFILENAYISNDTSKLVDFFGEYSKTSYYEFVSGWGGITAKEKAKIVEDLERNISKGNNNSILEAIKGIFGR